MNRNQKKKKQPEITKVYICNPFKNVKCTGRLRKGWCGIECFCTTNPGYSDSPIPLTNGQFKEEEKRRREK